jgi:quercetin dioxygenase-like cupin family protein
MGDDAADAMAGRVVRFSELTERGSAVSFIDSVLPGHLRMNYAIVGDTAVEDPDFQAALQSPHRFQIGLFEAPPGNGPSWHTHEYVELFVPLTGRWRYRYGQDPEGADAPDGVIELGPWDAISFPPELWRSIENASNENAFSLAVLDPHDAFVFKDPIWPESTVRRAAERGLEADASGRMIRPDNIREIEAAVLAQIRPTLGTYERSQEA